MKTWKSRTLCAALAAVLLLTCAVMPALADDLYMYVSTGNPGRLHLRALPTTNSESLGLYENGTRVLVESISNGWAFVQVGGQRGYMSLNCLTSVPPVTPAPAPTPVPTEDTTLYIRTGNSGRLHLREYASQNARSLGLYPNGTAVRVTSRSNGWAFVTVNGMSGYMMLKYLTSDAPAPQPTPDPGTYTLMYVRTGNSGKLHLREYASQNARSLGLYPNGTALYALNLGNGWAHVEINGVWGYMMTKYLTTDYVTPAPTATVVPPPAGAVWKYISTGNSGKLNLRENMSTDSHSLGQYPNGTRVAVVTDYGVWSYVYVSGRMGYMMSRYLVTIPDEPTAAPTPTPGPVQPTSTPGGNTAVVQQPNHSFVYLRSSQSSKDLSNVICKVPSDTVVTVIAWGKLWTKVRYNGYEGYMVTNYLK